MTLAFTACIPVLSNKNWQQSLSNSSDVTSPYYESISVVAPVATPTFSIFILVLGSVFTSILFDRIDSSISIRAVNHQWLLSRS